MTAAVLDAERGRLAALADLDVGVEGDEGRELPRQPAAGGAAAGVGDAAGGVAALEAEGEVAVAVGVEVDAEGLEVAEGVGRLVGEHAGGAGPHGAAAGLDRVVEVALRRVVGGGGGGEPALGPVGGGLGERRRRDEHRAGTGAGGGQRRAQPGRPGAHDDEVGVRQAAQG